MSLRKGLIIFIVLAFGANAIIIAKSVDQETLRSLWAADARMLLAALGVGETRAIDENGSEITLRDTKEGA